MLQSIEYNARIKAFAELGNIFRTCADEFMNGVKNSKCRKSLFLHESCQKAYLHNNWFIEPFIYKALEVWANALTFENISNWLEKYNLNSENENPKKTAVIMAGNIPLVGFHDFLCVLLTGNIFIGKCSQKDNILMPAIAKILIEIDTKFAYFIHFEENIVTDFDAIIATGSDSSGAFFEKYFENKKSIIRKHKNSVAVLDGTETTEDIAKLADDIFLYFGLGCRNVSKIFIPENFDINLLFKGFEKYSKIMMEHNKYMNNYDYRYSIMFLNKEKFFTNNFILLSESKAYSSGISVLNFEYYTDIELVKRKLKADEKFLQCIVANEKLKIDNSIPLGNAQEPSLSDYADNVDTIAFLIN